MNPILQNLPKVQTGTNGLPTNVGQSTAQAQATKIPNSPGSTNFNSGLLNTQSSTPATSKFSYGSVLGAVGNILNYLTPQSQSSITPTPTGGTSFNPTLFGNTQKATLVSVGGKTLPVVTQQNTTSGSHASSGLSQYLTHTVTTPSGAQLTLDTQGNVVGGKSSQGYSIDTSQVPSSALSSTYTSNDLNNNYNSYQDLVNGVSNAQGYSPAYLQALQQQYQTQNQGSYLQSVGAGLNANLATGNGFTGYSTGQAGAQTNINQALNTQQEALNTQQATQAGINLNTQQLARTGQIAAAQTQLQSSPAGMTGQNAINQYNTLQQQYPNAAIPSYNPSLSPEQNQQVANQAVANSPAYQAGFQSTYTTPGGGTGIYSKLNMNGFQQNQDGSLTLVPAAAAALGSANASIVQNQATNLSNINSAVAASTKTLASTEAFMNQTGLNQSDVPIINQIQNAASSQTQKAGYVTAFKDDLNGLRADYAQYLVGRGGSIAGTNDEANQAIPDTVSPAQLRQIVTQMQTVGQNTAGAISDQINSALSGIQNNNTGGSTSGTSTGSSSGGWY